MSLRRHIPLALSSLVLLGAPAAAQGAVYHDVEYRVEVNATLRASHTHAYNAENESLTRAAVTTSKIRGVIPTMLFRDTIAYNAAGQATARTTGQASGSYRAPDVKQDQNCTPKDATEQWGTTAIERDEIPPLTENIRMHVRVADAPDIEWGCTGAAGTLAIPPYTLTDGKNTVGTAALDASFDFPYEAIGYGKVIQRIQGPPSNFCAGKAEDPYTTSCSYAWSGTVTFVKIGESTLDDDPAPDPDTQQPAPAPVQGSQVDDRKDLVPPLVIDNEDPVAPLVLSQAAKADAQGGSVSFTATCPAGCSGSAALTVGAGAGKAAAAAKRATKPVATVKFSVKAAKKPRTVKLRLPRKAARALRRAGRGSLAVSLKPKRGKTVKRTFAVKVARKR